MPVYNRAHLLDRVLESLAVNTTYPVTELVVVDDGSTDGSADVVRRWGETGRLPRLELVEKPNSGAIDSLNTALATASGDFCVQLDDDVTIATPGWVERMLEVMTLDDAVGVVSPKVVFDNGMLNACGVDVVSPSGWHARPMRPAEPIGRRRWLARTVDVPEGEGGDAEHRLAEVDSGIGCCMMYRREDAVAVGGYDSRYAPVWFDDVDLCLSIRARGRKVFYLPDVRVIHHFGSRRGPDGPLARFRPVRLARAFIRRTGGRLPYRVGAVIERRIDIDLEMRYTRAQRARLRHHYAYWREKWGWDARNPDMDEIQRRWGGTEIWWARDPERRAAGERIVAAYAANVGQSAHART